MAPIAVTRAVSSCLGQCELTHLDRQPILVERARRQHAAYEAVLRSCGCEVHRLPEAAGLPDAVFVEDTAVVLEEVAVVTRPGAVSRRPEVEAVAAVLARWRVVARLEAPATLDGGDVLRVGRRLWVGLSSRSDRAGVAQLAALLGPHGYGVQAVPMTGCLHLKTAVTAVDDERLLLNPAWVDPAAFSGLQAIAVDPAEPFAANALRIGARVVYPSAHPRTADRLADLGLDLVTVDVSELAKAEGAVTCCSLIVSQSESLRNTTRPRSRSSPASSSARIAA